MDMRLLPHTMLFRGLREDEILSVLSCLGAYEKSFDKDGFLCRAGETVTCMGLVLQGSVNIVVHSYWGGSSIFGHIGPGEVFAEAYASLPGKELLVDVVAAEPVSALFLPVSQLIIPCSEACPFHARTASNLLQIMARKNLHLSTRMMHTAPRSIRARLLSYLSEQAAVHGSSQFTIPFSRQQLADYLEVDRSALSNELSKMRQDGLLTYHKNQFTLIES